MGNRFIRFWCCLCLVCGLGLCAVASAAPPAVWYAHSTAAGAARFDSGEKLLVYECGLNPNCKVYDNIVETAGGISAKAYFDLSKGLWSYYGNIGGPKIFICTGDVPADTTKPFDQQCADPPPCPAPMTRNMDGSCKCPEPLVAGANNTCVDACDKYKVSIEDFKAGKRATEWGESGSRSTNDQGNRCVPMGSDGSLLCKVYAPQVAVAGSGADQQTVFRGRALGTSCTAKEAADQKTADDAAANTPKSQKDCAKGMLFVDGACVVDKAAAPKGPQDCNAGQAFGQVNGKNVCLDQPKDPAQPPKPYEGKDQPTKPWAEGKLPDEATGQCPAGWAKSGGYCWNPSDTVSGGWGSGSGSGSGAGSGTGSGAGAGDGTGDKGECEKNPSLPICTPGANKANGPETGEIYKKADGTIQGTLEKFRQDTAGAPVVQAATGFWSVSVSGSCPTWTLPATKFTPSIPLDFLCGEAAQKIYDVMAPFVMVVATIVAFSIAFL